VWRAWRGDRAKLARIARAMESCYPAGDFVRARVDVRVRGDNESYGNVTRFAREASSQTTDELDSLTLATDGGQGRIEVALSRRSPRGVIVTVEPSVGSPPVWAADALDTVDRAVSRGSIRLPPAEHIPVLKRLVTYWPTRGPQGASTASATLRHREADHGSRVG
jgi:hypothetical protein